MITFEEAYKAVDKIVGNEYFSMIYDITTYHDKTCKTVYTIYNDSNLFHGKSWEDAIVKLIDFKGIKGVCVDADKIIFFDAP